MTDNVKSVSGAIILISDIPTMVMTSPGLEGATTPIGAFINRAVTRILNGETTPTGAFINRAVTRILIGTEVAWGSLPTMVMTSLGLEGATTFAGTVRRSITSALAGSLSFVGRFFHPIPPTGRKYIVSEEDRVYVVRSD